MEKEKLGYSLTGATSGIGKSMCPVPWRGKACHHCLWPEEKKSTGTTKKRIYQSANTPYQYWC